MKYFYYISQAKVDMLLPQLRRKRFRLPSLSPKFGFAGVSVGAEIRAESDESLVNRTLSLLKRLEKGNLVEALDSSTKLAAKKFYHIRTSMRHGLYYFEAGMPRRYRRNREEGTYALGVTYVAWTAYRDSLILLVGSPNNICGEKVVRSGLFVPGTGGAVEEIMNVIDSLRSDEPHAVTQRGSPHVQLGSDYKFDGEIHELEDQFVGPIRFPRPGSEDSGLSLGMFCYRYLKNLPETEIDTVFRIFSVTKAKGASFRSDLQQEYDAEAKVWGFGKDEEDYIKEREKEWEDLFALADQARLDAYRNVIIGSPVYTALE